jgi:hypothetical protein
MKQAGHDLLADPGRPGDQHARTRRRDPLDRGADLLHDRCLADELALVAQFQLELCVLPLQTGGLSRALDQHQQALGVERLFKEVVSALLNRGDRGFDRAVTADHDHRHVGMAAPDQVEHLEAVQLRALEPDIQEHRSGRLRFDFCQRRAPVAGMAHVVTLIPQDRRDRVAHLGLVVDDQNVCRHFDPDTLPGSAARCRGASVELIRPPPREAHGRPGTPRLHRRLPRCGCAGSNCRRVLP